jgi:hypothetical protein
MTVSCRPAGVDCGADATFKNCRQFEPENADKLHRFGMLPAKLEIVRGTIWLGD